MSAPAFHVDLDFREKWTDYDADGENCAFCTDVIYMGGKRVIGEYSVDKVHWFRYFEWHACQSCTDE